MKDFNEIIEKIKETKELAESNPGSNPMNYSTRLGKIKRAKEDLQELYLEYRKHVQMNALFVLVTGSQADQFVSIATSPDFGCFSVDAEDFYKEITDIVNERLYVNQVASRNLFDLVGSAMEEKAEKVGIVGYPALIFESKHKKMLTNKEDMIKLIKEAFNERIGSEVVGLDAIDKVTRAAIDAGFTGKNIPIILLVKDEGLVIDLHNSMKKTNKNVFIVSSGKTGKDAKELSLLSLKTVDDKAVESSLLKIKENLN